MARNVFGWSYPAGAENDSRAPWNQQDPADCRECRGDGCEMCDWEGVVYPKSRQEIEEEKADAAMDRAKDERE